MSVSVCFYFRTYVPIYLEARAGVGRETEIWRLEGSTREGLEKESGLGSLLWDRLMFKLYL